jgi:hypothetical protein
MICDDQENLMVDYVGRFESVAEDLQHICERLKISVALPHKNKSNHGDYRSYYNTRTRDLVTDLCRLDIDLFGYTFDCPSGEGARAA